LIETAKIGEFPLVLMGKEFWRPSRDFMSNRLVAGKTDSRPEAIEAITDAAKRRWFFGATEPG